MIAPIARLSRRGRRQDRRAGPRMAAAVGCKGSLGVYDGHGDATAFTLQDDPAIRTDQAHFAGIEVHLGDRYGLTVDRAEVPAAPSRARGAPMNATPGSSAPSPAAAPTRPTQPAGPLEAPPETIGKFRVLERLGGGAMGVVYKCSQPDLDRPVAVKVL